MRAKYGALAGTGDVFTAYPRRYSSDSAIFSSSLLNMTYKDACMPDADAADGAPGLLSNP